MRVMDKQGANGRAPEGEGRGMAGRPGTWPRPPPWAYAPPLRGARPWRVEPRSLRLPDRVRLRGPQHPSPRVGGGLSK